MDRVILYEVTLEEDSGAEVTIEEDQTAGVEVETPVRMLVNGDYNILENKPKINGVELTGDKSFDDLGLPHELPEGGQNGDILTRVGSAGTAWLTPADSPEQDNTRPITAAAVYDTVGNINALLEII